jgi:hypothetical protein
MFRCIIIIIIIIIRESIDIYAKVTELVKLKINSINRGHVVVQWLRHCATGAMVSEFFIDIILPAALWPWGRLSLLTEMSTRNISWG